MLLYFIKIFLISLICTLIIELIFAFIIGIKDKKDILNIILVNLLTNPLLVAISLFININYGANWKNYLIIPLEIIVFIVEGLVYKKYLNFKKINPYVISLILNICSYGIGEILNNLIY